MKIGSEILRKRAALDRKDLRILAVLDKMGGSASAQEIGEALDIPARTVRYRLSVLMERGMLLPSYYQTHERKVGLGERMIVVQENAGKGDTLEAVIKEVPSFYWYIPSHGKMDGYLIHAVYDLREPDKLEKIIKRMREREIIEEYYSFEIADYESKRVDFSKYRPDGEWRWNWGKWRDELSAKLETDAEMPHNMTEEIKIIDCDSSDIKILRELKESSESSASAIASITGIPVANVREKLQRLRDNGVIKDYRRAYGFAGDLLWLSCFVRIRDNPGAILAAIYDLPHPATILMESKGSYCIRFGFTTSDLKGFLEGFRVIRPYLESYSFQFHLPDEVESTYGEVFNFFDDEKNRWEIPLEESLAIIDKHAKE
ncbi:MAG: Lrp/AsnC family transcriptional regulator [Promethearchaeota archaeon]